ncbi:MAG TPA: hypothetical protein VHM47_03740 [Actinomycetota bacterium]|jgi:hypothetical protein|nr:hypothetical protein [Actinomycetota bacterium]
MPVFGVDLTVCDASLTDEQRLDAGDLSRVAREIYGDDVIVERWEHDDVGYLRIIATVSAPTLVDAFDTISARSRRARDRLALKAHQQIGVSVAIRDLSHPIDLSLPPVRLPRWSRA